MFRLAKQILIGASIVLLAGCSVNLSQGNLEGVSLTNEKYSFFGQIPLIFGNDTIPLNDNLLRAYTATASAEEFPREHCRGIAAVQAKVTRNEQGSAWILGAVIIPIWPAMPVDETWNYTLIAQIFCDGTLVKHVEFTEEESVKAFWYGMLRSNLVNDASSEMHRKLVQRLAFELGERAADLNSASDY